MAMKAGGGIAQKLARMEADDPPQPSSLAEKLLGLWSWRAMSAPRVQELALAAYNDGLVHPQIERLAMLGAKGKFPGNMQRDLLAIAVDSTALLKAQTSIPIRLKKEEGGVSEVVNLSFLLPHKLFAFIFEQVPSAFETSILGDDAANIPRFWAAMRTHPVVTSRPDLQAPSDLSKVIPLAIHGDGVSYMQTSRAGGKSLDVISWSSVLSKGPTKTSSFLMFLLVKTLAKDFGMGQTWPRVWKILCWSLEVLATGLWPMQNWDHQDFEEDSIDHQKRGTPLADGYRGVVFILRSDLEFLSNHFGLESPASNTPCALCKADRNMDSRPWTDVRASAEWRQTSWKRAEWDTAHPNCHVFFKMHGGGIDLVFPDLMHCKHLGTDQLLLGSVLAWLVRHYLKGTVKENLSIVWAFIQKWYKECVKMISGFLGPRTI